MTGLVNIEYTDRWSGARMRGSVKLSFNDDRDIDNLIERYTGYYSEYQKQYNVSVTVRKLPD